MKLYKCKCGFMSNHKEIDTCPKCKQTNPEFQDTNSFVEDEILICVTMEDVDLVIDNLLDKRIAQNVKNQSRETIKELLEDKLNDSNWVDDIHCILTDYYK